MLAFWGEVVVAAGRLCGARPLPFSAFLESLWHCGARALPIVSLFSVLVGLILAFVGAVQLKMFGAQIYVGLGMVRVLALVLMMPLLCLCADLMGIAGGFILGVGMLDLPFKQYLVQTSSLWLC